MAKTLIIAEKPSQAREYAKVLGVRGTGEGYLENDQYVITWCYGHLLELERPEAYMDLDRVGKRWSLRRLPVLPGVKDFRRVVKQSALKQYQVIQRWLRSADIQDVICGTDADREGQLLFQEIWDSCHCTKPLSRLWISSLTKAAIREGLASLRSADSVTGLAAAGYGRSFADWDFGMNLTEGFTALFGSFDQARNKPNVISIGRVQTPTLALIVEREWEIEDFVPQSYFEVWADFAAGQGGYSGKWFNPAEETKRLTNRQDAENIIANTQDKPGLIVQIEQKDVQEPPPLLFDLTSLSVAASRKYGFSAEKVLQLAQSLYEKKAITYPRTDCAYLPKDIIPRLSDHLKAIRQDPYTGLADEAGLLGVPAGKRVINTITAHHAIIPTTEPVLLESLPGDAQKLFDLIIRRFLAVWFPPARYHQTIVVTRVEDESFKTKGKVLLNSGWKKVFDPDDLDESSEPKTKKHEKREETDMENAALPPLKDGEDVRVQNIHTAEKTTKPPKRFSQGDLLKAMEGAGKQVDDELLRQQLKGKGLGTVATRPAIIENLLERGYILQEQKALKPTGKGTELIRLIKERLPQAQLLISAEMTGQMEYDLAKVEKGELTIELYMADAEKAVRRIIEELQSFGQKYGKRPLAFAPTAPLPKDRKGAKTTPKKKIQVKTPANSALKGNNSKLAAGKNPAEILGTCPNCGGEVIEGQKGFGCVNWREGCHFVIWKDPICGKVLTSNQVKSLLKKGKTPLIKGFKSQSGKSFAAYLIWDKPAEAKLKFVFAK